MNETNPISNNSSNINNILLSIPYLANIWIGGFFLITGNIGCIGNMIIFKHRTFRNQAYTNYLFFQSISDFFLINFLLSTRILQKGFQISVVNRYEFLCKLRLFSTNYLNETSFTFFTFATIDRILSAQRSNSYRQWSNRFSLSYKIVLLWTLFWFLFTGHRLVLYRIINKTCGPSLRLYVDIDAYIEIIMVGLCPLVTMFILAYILIKSVRNVIKRQTAVIIHSNQNNITKRSQLQQMDSQLTVMLILQSIIAIITFLPYGSELLYIHITRTWYKTPLRLAIEKIITEITHIFAYTFFASSFYVSIISSNGFRRQVKNLFKLNKKYLSKKKRAIPYGIKTSSDIIQTTN